MFFFRQMVRASIYMLCGCLPEISDYLCMILACAVLWLYSNTVYAAYRIFCIQNYPPSVSMYGATPPTTPLPRINWNAHRCARSFHLILGSVFLFHTTSWRWHYGITIRINTSCAGWMNDYLFTILPWFKNYIMEIWWIFKYFSKRLISNGSGIALCKSS